MEKYFNIAGPCILAEHYMLPTADDILCNLPAIRV